MQNMDHKDAKNVTGEFRSVSSSVILVVCKKIFIGEVNIIPESDLRLHWLVINSATKCLTVLDSMELEPLEATQHPPCEVFSVTEDNTQMTKICREGSELVIQVKTISSPRFHQPLELLDECSRDVTFTVSPGRKFPEINKMLREIFGRKYQEEEPRFVSPYSARSRRAGYVVTRKTQLQWKSSSSVSSSSLNLLRDKLEDLPHYVYNKQRESVCATPDLSRITEFSEESARSSENISNRSKVKHWGEVRKGITKKTKCNEKARSLSPVINDENSISFLLVATVGTADQTVINDTIEKFSKNKSSSSDNIVDSLIKEALRIKKVSDNNCSKSNDSKCDNSDIIENTQAAELDCQFSVKNASAVEEICDSTINDSVSSPVNFITFRKKKTSTVLNETDELILYKNEDSPFQTRSPNKDRKDITTDSSDNLLFEVNEIDIIECINNIVDTVCDDFDKCAQYLHKKNSVDTMTNRKKTEKSTLPRSSINPKSQNKPKSKMCVSSKKKALTEKLKIKFNFSKNKRTQKKKIANNAHLEKTVKKSVIGDDVIDNISEDGKIANIDDKFMDANTPKSRKKRKLYSPKDDQNNMSTPCIQIPETEDDTTLSEFQTYKNVTPKSRQNTYKEIVNERQKRNRRLRTPTTKTICTSYSKNDKLDEIFDKLKVNSSNDQPVNLINPKSSAKDLAVYNYTSESDDEDFKESAIYKRLSATTVDSVESTTSQRGRIINRINYTESKSNASKDKHKSVRKNNKLRNVVERKNSKAYFVKHHELIDEKVRDAGPDVLNTSLITENISMNFLNKDVEPVEPIINATPKIEAIHNDVYCETINSPKSNKKDRKKNSKLEKKTSNRKGKKNTRDAQKERAFSPLIDLDNRTESPLPGLVIEEARTANEDVNDSLTINMIEKFKERFKGRAEPESINTSKIASDIYRIDDSALNFVHDETLVLNCVSERNECNKSNPSPSPKTVALESDFTLINSNSTSAKIYKLNNHQTNKSKKKPSSKSRTRESNEFKISEQSYSTLGMSPIRARRNSDENPPSIEALEKTIQPRDLDIEYLNQSEISFLNGLRQAPYETATKKSSPISNESNKNSSSAKLVCNSLSIKNQSESAYEKYLSKHFLLARTIEYSDESNSPSNTLTQNNNSAVNQKVIKRSENPERTGIDIISSNYDQRANNSTLDPESTNDSPKPTESKSGYDELLSSKNSNQQSNPKFDARPNCTKNSEKHTFAKETQSQEESQCINKSSNTKRRSLISPVRSFDDKIKLREVKPNNFDIKKRGLHNNNNNENKDINNKENEIRIKKNALKFPSKALEDVIEEFSGDSESETKIPERFAKSKRKLPEINNSNVKKRKLNERDKYIKNWVESQQVVTETVESIRKDAKEYLQGLVEKVDTTLVDMNENTNEMLVQYFVENNKRENKLKKEFHELYKQTAREVMLEFTKVLDTKFTELYNKSQEQSDEAIKQMKLNALELIKKDAQKKRVFVAILKEDLQLVLDRMNKRPKPDA